MVTDTYDYDAFGNKINPTGTTPNNYLYRGEQYDSDLGLYYLRARYYNPLTGRFMSRDPKDPQLIDSHRVPLDPKGRHKYLYAGGDPVNMIDPTGKGFIEDLLIEGQEKAAGLWALARTEASLVALFACVDDVMEDAFNIDAAFEFCLENPE
jgi:RHS repeat-associated protein